MHPPLICAMPYQSPFPPLSALAGEYSDSLAPSRCLHVRRCQIDGDGAEEGSARPPIDPRLFDEFVAWSAVVRDVAPPLPAAAASWLYHGRRTVLGCKLHSTCGRRYVCGATLPPYMPVIWVFSPQPRLPPPFLISHTPSPSTHIRRA